MENMYRAAWSNKLFHHLPELLEAPAIERKFRFLGDYFNELVRNGNYEHLALPVFNEEKDFAHFVEQLEGKKEGLLKRYGAMTKKYGIQFLNNMYFLRRMYKPEKINLDKMLQLDHSKEISAVTGPFFVRMEMLQQIYSLERYFRLMTTEPVHPQYIVDSYRILIEYEDLTFEILKAGLPKKPRNIKDVHDTLMNITKKIKRKNRSLDQDLVFLEGHSFREFTIEVPRDSQTLHETSDELRHCVHSYTERVIRKDCQIINLKREDKRVYTIELRPTAHGWRVNQFKGYRNDNTMELDPSEKIYRELLDLIMRLTTKNNESG
jgi:hypothetical protein